MNESQKQILLEDLKYIKSEFRIIKHLTHLSKTELTRYKDDLSNKKKRRPWEFEGLEYHFFDLENSYSNFLYYGYFLTAYSFFEHRSRFIALRIEHWNKEKFSVDEIKGRDYIGSLKKYLEKTSNFEKNVLKNLDNDLNYYRFIRNSIAHRNGFVSLKYNELNPSNLIKKIMDDDRVDLNKFGKITIKDSLFVEDFIEFGIEYIEKITNKIIE